MSAIPREGIMFQSKLADLLRSRKFWASLLGLVAVFVLTFAGIEISEETLELLIAAIMAIVGIFTFSTALEDGLSRRA
jgi:uncharacterized membrane protein